ncbi:hypothetical protein LTR16_000280 [Cryomyces antarcticus]|uniref:Carbohydrate-binding-like protein n=1 Tax=Cryomyces antarcticus TaxID=329879 RepID=A0ABR0KUR8_9PEZI|nr:hypothetical protein LTR39_000150 [Cryomyces antarcticus]KAK5021217.1 hypothetical protein LTR60_000082 [Cryomyces antarcticus]KAK5131927.1 hypothetical protein LTR16_000280 [Cryomyces antarcticus]
MRSALVFGAFAALAAASPVPQEIDYDSVDAAGLPPTATIPIVGATAQVVTYDAAAAASSVAAEVTQDPASARKRDLGKRDGSCAVQPTGILSLVPSPDTASAFLAADVFAAAATSASTPSGYTDTFTNLKASNNAYGYMGYTTLQSYNPTLCSQKCDKINGCAAFNIYFERDPSLDPNSINCPNPKSVTNIKCVFWGGPVTAANANNAGQWRDSFQVVIAGSNGYVNNTIEPAQGYSQPNYLGNAAINAPNDCTGANTYMGFKLFQDGPFDANLCATACSAQSAYNLAHPPAAPAVPQTCQFFNTYLLLKNGASVGQYCSMYSESWANSYATNKGSYQTNSAGATDHYTITYSYSFSNSTNPGVPAGPCVKV